MIENWEKAYSGKIEVEPGHIIGRCKEIQAIKDELCRYNIHTGEKTPGKYDLDSLQIEIKDETLNQWEKHAKIKIGTVLLAKKQIYKVIQEIFNKKILLKDESRAIKKEHGMNYTLTIQKPTNGNYPVIIMTGKYNYVIAPRIKGN